MVPLYGHLIKIRCDTQPTASMCDVECNKILIGCGHVCKKLCKQNFLPCETIIRVDSPCQPHLNSKIELKCWENQVWNQTKCKKPCITELECSHMCNCRCGECLSGLILKKCNQK